MKCPMLTMYAITLSAPEEFKDRDCLKEGCAWWDTTRRACAVEHIAYNLRILAEEAVDIRNKMPHEGQFRK